MRLPPARRPGHPFREPGHRVEQHLLARVREQARLEPLRIRPRQAEVSGLPQRRRGVSVRVPHSIGGIAQMLRGHSPGVKPRPRRPGHTAGEPAEREPDGILPRVREGFRDRAAPAPLPRVSLSPGPAFSRRGLPAPGRRPGDLGPRGPGQPPGQLREEPPEGVRPVPRGGQPGLAWRGHPDAAQRQAPGATGAGLGDPDREPGQRVRGDREGEVAAPRDRDLAEAHVSAGHLPATPSSGTGRSAAASTAATRDGSAARRRASTNGSVVA